MRLNKQKDAAMNKGNEPMVSVLMIAYNRESYIEEALKSVLCQKTTFNFEIIISEDCSIDNTLAICQKYKQLFPNQINLIANEKNLGLQRNYIQAYKAAKGKYIAICDPDDYWINRNKLQLQFDFLENNPKFSLCFHRVLNYYENDKSKSLSNGGQKVITTIVDLSTSNYISNVSVFFRNNLFELPSGIETFAYFDYLLHMLCAEKGNIYYFSKVMAVYRKHSTGISSEENREKALRESILVRQFLINHFKGNEKVIRNLKYAEAAILNSLYNIALSKNETEKSIELWRQLTEKHPDWLEAKQTNTKRSIHKIIIKKLTKTLTFIRKTISKYYPLPRIR